MLSETQKKLILDLAIERGYSGKKGGKFIARGGVSSSSDAKRFLKALGFPDALLKYSDVPEMVQVIFKYPDYISEIGQVLHEGAKQFEKDLPVMEGVEESEIADLNSYLETLYPIINLTSVDSRDQIILINPADHRPVNRVSLDIYLAKTGRKLNEIITSDRIMSVVPYFNPYSLEPFVTRFNHDLQIPIRHLNLYRPPLWRKAHVAPAYGGFIKQLMEWLFPVAQEREDVLDWLHYAIVRRNGSILCLAGPRGTGKSLLMMVLSYLVGNDYSEYVNKEILEEKFNSAFKDKRLIIFEEVEVTSSTAVNKLKAFANNRISVEEKGRDSETIDNYTSMAILLNDVSQLRIDAQDRRFSVPEVAQHDLRKCISEKAIQDFVDRLEDTEEVFEEVAAFGEWLIKRRPTRSHMHAIKNDYYYMLCTLAMSEWKNFLIDYIAEKGEEGVSIPIKRISNAFKARFGQEEGTGRGLKFPDRVQTIELFLKDYKHRGDTYIGSFVKEYDEDTNKEIPSIIPSVEFLDFIESSKKSKMKAEAEIDAMEVL